MSGYMECWLRLGLLVALLSIACGRNAATAGAGGRVGEEKADEAPSVWQYHEADTWAFSGADDPLTDDALLDLR